MKMAKASEADLTMAMELANYLDSIERGYMPDKLSADDEASEWIETSGNNQYERLMEGLTRLLNQGSIMRVIFGMAVVCDPKNRCLDPNADTLEEHPDFEKAEKQRDELLAALECVLTTRNAEAKASMAFNNASENYSDDSIEHAAYEKAMIKASNAESEARAAIARVKGRS